MARLLTTETFARKLQDMLGDDDCKIVWFLGAGCSISSGIPGAGSLVDRWLPRLKMRETGSNTAWQEWAHTEFPGFDEANPGKVYGGVIDALFPLPRERQKEVELLISQKDPSIGYALLAVLAAHAEWGPKSNIVLTTNFDDLVADALYLMTRTKPLVVAHESLAGFVRQSRNRPLVVKVHGDGRLTPLNTTEETATLDADLIKNVTPLFAGCALIFVGYGGNDQSIRNLLEAAPFDGFQGGIFWVGNQIPENPVGAWLRGRSKIKNDVFHVENNDFDDLFLQLRETLKLDVPDGTRLTVLFQTYSDRLKKDEYAPTAEISPEKKSRAGRARRAVDAITLASRARELERSDTKLANDLYEKALNADPELLFALGSYANFLTSYLKDNSRANEMYARALAVDPDSPVTLGNYANFLADNEKDYPQAKEMYERALAVDPNHPLNLDNYANFLAGREKDYPRAKEMFERALVIDPHFGYTLANYANFLAENEKDYPRAKEMFEQALAADPDNPVTLGRFAILVANREKDYRRAKELYERSLAVDTDHPVTLGNYAVFLADQERDYSLAETMFQRSLAVEPSNALTLGNHASFIADRLMDYSRANKEFERALSADPGNPLTLGKYAAFLAHYQKDYARAKEMYERSLEGDPDNPVALGNYAVLLVMQEKDYPRAKEMYERALVIDPSNMINLGNYAAFLADYESDYPRAKETYERALAGDPGNMVNLGNYANFLVAQEKDYPRAKEMYERALVIDPHHANTLGNYANFLVAQEKDYPHAKEMYERALLIEPNNANTLGNYANFLVAQEKDYPHAKEMYERALLIEPNNANTLGNYAQLLLGLAKDDQELSQAMSALEQTIARPDASNLLRLELLLYQFIHRPESGGKIGPIIFKLISEGVRSDGWSFEINLNWARERSDIRLAFLTQLANVISGLEDAATLAEYPEWIYWADHN
jgi:Tfp pilus assembly protein PilF